MLKLLVFISALSAIGASSGIITWPLRLQFSPPAVATRSGKQDVVPTSVPEGEVVLGTIQLGEERQEIIVNLDTGSSTLVVPSRDCWNCGNNRGFKCRNISQDYAALLYGTGYAQGHICTDTVTIHGLRAKGQTFVVTSEQKTQGIDAILGLGYQILNVYRTPYGTVYTAPTVFETLARQNNISKIFSFYISRKIKGEGSFLALGGSRRDYYKGQLQYFPVQKYEGLYLHWQIQTSSMKIGDKTIPDSSGSAIIDTGTNLLCLSNKIFYGYFRKYLPEYNPRAATQMSCEDAGKLPTFSFQFGESVFTVENEHYVIRDNDGLCYVFVSTNERTGDTTILGVPFLKKHYTEFDMENNRIGFALAK